ncbi:MAG: class I SAM-dependent methyltransferase [Desulfovibrio sp.]|jgi:SAM-dependent methyltransferase|nr:class I SAM-dependent methyltransferase [Desulfovibrio sp.]
MDNSQLTTFDLLIEAHIGLERQGPGSHEMTAKALSFLDIDGISRTADLGCGTGCQAMTLARHIHGSIVCLDQIPSFIAAVNDNAKNHNLQDRICGIVGLMEALPFQKGELDLIWSEGAVDAIGFEHGLPLWNYHLRLNGYICISCPCWFTEEHPAELEKFWSDAGVRLNTIEQNISSMKKSGFVPIAMFILPEECWVDNYYTPRTDAQKVLVEKYAYSKTVVDYIEHDKHEVELYTKYKHIYGYAFFIGKKCRVTNRA